MEACIVLVEVTKVTMRRNIVLKYFMFTVVTHISSLSKFRCLCNMSIEYVGHVPKCV